MGSAESEGMQQLQRQEVVAVVDIVPERANRAAERWGVPRWFSDHRQVLRLPEVDAVDICTPHGAHAPVALAALRAGKHVLVESRWRLT